jgi:acyl carrier protein
MNALAPSPHAPALEPNAAVEAIVRRALPPASATAPIDADAPLTRLGLSSMASVSLMLAIEEHFKIVIPDGELRPENFLSLGAIQVLVDRLARA